MIFKTVAISLLAFGAVRAEFEMPTFFSDGMVLQREGEAKIWGWEAKGTTVTVVFGDQTKTAKANGEGRWVVSLKNLAATNEGQDLTITSEDRKKVIHDVVVGEVWLASGQSNMEFKLARAQGGKEAIANSVDPLLRVYLTPNVSKDEPQIDFPGKWATASPETASEMTAVGYFFAKRLREELQVPVGIIECAWGGRPVEAFTSEEALKALPEGKKVLKKKANAIAAWKPEAAQEKLERVLAKWEENKRGPRPSCKMARV